MTAALQHLFLLLTTTSFLSNNSPWIQLLRNDLVEMILQHQFLLHEVLDWEMIMTMNGRKVVEIRVFYLLSSKRGHSQIWSQIEK
jgi:hypothetical protein